MEWISYATNGSVVPTFKVNISGIPNGGRLDLFDNNGTIQTLTNGVNDIEGFTANGATGFLIYSGLELNWSNLVIQQIGEYEGAFCLDGIKDYITFPSLSSGGKQVLMKVNWGRQASMLYDQRTGNNSSFAIYALDVANYVAYNRFVRNGNTYLDGILNRNILCEELKGITHNIVCTNGESPNKSPIIGSNFDYTQDFARMSLYDFMLFDEISTDEEILALNEYIGIEGNVTIPTVNIDFTDTSKWQSSSAVINSTTVRLDVDSVGEGDVLRSITSIESFTVHIKLYNASLYITYTDTSGEETQKFISGENYITEHDFTLPDTSSIMFYTQGVPNDGYAELTV